MLWSSICPKSSIITVSTVTGLLSSWIYTLAAIKRPIPSTILVPVPSLGQMDTLSRPPGAQSDNSVVFWKPILLPTMLRIRRIFKGLIINIILGLVNSYKVMPLLARDCPGAVWAFVWRPVDSNGIIHW